MKTFEKIEKVVSFISKILGYFGYACMLAIVFLTVADVIARKIFKPINGAFELTEYLLLMFVFASFAYCQMLDGHIKVTILMRGLPKKLAFVLTSITSLLATFVMFYVGYAAVQQAISITEKGMVTDVLKITQAPFIWVEAVCMFVFAITCLFDCAKNVFAIFNDDMKEKLMSKWD